MTYHLKNYLTHCSTCDINQIKKHHFYDVLCFIISSIISFYTITINFIVNLSKQKKYNMILSVIDKFLKQVTLLSENIEYSAD